MSAAVIPATNKTTSESLLDSDTQNKLVLPGDCLLRHEKDIIASTGTYLRNGYIFASIAGHLEIELIKENIVSDAELGDGSAPKSESESYKVLTKRVVRVLRPGAKNIPFLEPGAVVTARVLRITSNLVKCSIHCIGDHTLKQPYTGMIRSDDIRDYDRDKISVNRSFRPGDIILARVFAHGENHQFLLTTAAPELGVVIATNDWGEPMIPISLTEVLCPRTYTKEPRKVAKIDLISKN